MPRKDVGKKETDQSGMTGGAANWFERRWRLWVLLFWLGVAAFLIFERWARIHWFALSDTDDNLRIAQVRALIEGQSWYDLRQYRLNPPFGADVHWSRLVDLPIAGIKLLLSPLIGGAAAERAAVTVAPLLPMLVAMFAMAVAARRLIAPWAFALAVPLLACAGSARLMWSPLRIDHHGWQLALLAVAVMALTDERRARGGLILGLATALSLAIGLEMLLYLAAAGAVTVLMWVRDVAETRRLATYGASLAGGCALAFLVFASEANRAPVCDALSPVWLSAMTAAGGTAVALASLSPAIPAKRFAAAAICGLLLAAGFALLWPDCLGRLEQAPPELERLWLSKVREAMPVYGHGARTVALIVTLPVLGLIGYAAMLWRHRRDAARLVPWAVASLLAFIAAALLLWQTRAAPAAQLLSIPGATALGWLALRWLWERRSLPVLVAGIVGLALVFLAVSGIGMHYFSRLFPPEKSERRKQIDLANRRCPTMAALRPVAQQPSGTVLTFVDLGPRLIAVTPHSAITGPYHRNAEQIVDVMHAWRGDAANARRTAARYGVDYVLICPNLSESTIYRAEAPKGFYVQLARGQAPGWLDPVELPENSPYRMWRVRR